ncbi:MAG: menaquinone biosynthesis protein [Bacteroidia bacterium]|nr:menaquinone biosynthesis protein [Bacteroidia bacterium]
MKISVVSYLNSAPLVYGIQHSAALKDCSLSLDVPSVGAAKLVSGEADIALVPVGAFIDPGQVEWFGNYCIGVEGPVRTVCLFSEVPLNEIRKVYLDPHSRTSVQLIRILAREHWKYDWEFIPAAEGFEYNAINGNNAGVCIGDKVFGIEGRYPYRYDLAEEWIRFSGLPFVFAAWAVKRPVDSGFIDQLDLAQMAGIKAIPDVARDWSLKINLPESEIREYLTRNISYPFTKEKKEGMERFFSFIRSQS